MGILKDSISSAFGANQVNNGFGGLNLPFGKRGSSASGDTRRGYTQSLGASSVQSAGSCSPYTRNSYSADYDFEDSQTSQQTNGSSQWSTLPSLPTHHDFRPVILPQTSFGNGQPFLRAYSNELQQYGILEQDFIELVDAINIANTPNPENQIFQKAAGIAGWYVPGAASFGLMDGQIVAGLGAYVGHESMLKRVLSKANLETFLPVGLEICIGKTLNVDQDTGLTSDYSQHCDYTSPQQQVSRYGNRVAELTTICPPLQNVGRQDPITMSGRGIANRSNQKKIDKSQEDMQKGMLRDMDSVLKSSKLLIVRRASPDTIAHWKSTLVESNAEIEQAKSKAQYSPRNSGVPNDGRTFRRS